MKIALVHDFLLKLGGAERVLKVLTEMFPEAPVFCLLYDQEAVGKVFPEERIQPSFLQNYPAFIRKKYRYLTHKMPRAIEELDFSGYDLVISSSSAFAHGIVVPSGTTHICYCHSPMRYAWDWKNEYLEENKIDDLKSIFYSMLIRSLREWDFVAADRPDFYLANSKNVQGRLKKYYKMNSEVLYPPVDMDRFEVADEHENFFLIVSTLTPYKKIDLAVELFNKIQRKLVIIGDGPSSEYLKSIAGDNVEFMGFQDDDVVQEKMKKCRALIFPGEEDFGITPVEAMACGKPVLGYARGGLLETVIPGKTGELFDEQNLGSMEDGLARLMHNEQFYRPETIRKWAEQFSRQIFEKKLTAIIKKFKD